MITVRMEIFSFGRTISSAPQHNGALITIKPRIPTPGTKQMTFASVRRSDRRETAPSQRIVRSQPSDL